MSFTHVGPQCRTSTCFPPVMRSGPFGFCLILWYSSRRPRCLCLKSLLWQTQKLDELGCLSICIGFCGARPQWLYFPQMADLAEDETLTNFVVTAMVNKLSEYDWFTMAIKPGFHMSRKFQTVWDVTVSLLFLILLTNETRNRRYPWWKLKFVLSGRSVSVGNRFHSLPIP